MDDDLAITQAILLGCEFHCAHDYSGFGKDEWWWALPEDSRWMGYGHKTRAAAAWEFLRVHHPELLKEVTP